MDPEEHEPKLFSLSEAEHARRQVEPLLIDAMEGRRLKISVTNPPGPPARAVLASPESATVTWRRVISETRKVGICELSAKGSSYIMARFGITLKA